MTRLIPPFPAVRAFEAAARLMSFTRAAEELCITQSAVSHQVKQLEKLIGKPLFERDPRGLGLTPAGKTYLEEISGILDSLADSTARLSADKDRTLSVQTTPAFAARWLIPRMSRFTDETGIALNISRGLPPTDFTRGDLDLVIQWGEDSVDGAVVEAFMHTPKIAVCSPGLLKGRAVPRTPSDLKHFTLLRDDVGDCWAEWLAGCGAEDVDATTGPSFAHCDLVLNAVEHDCGIALAYAALVERELEEGSLLRLFEHQTGPKTIYSLAYLQRRRADPRIRQFRDWIFEEIGMEPKRFRATG